MYVLFLFFSTTQMVMVLVSCVDSFGDFTVRFIPKAER
jgi:hypothetical protein